MSANAPAPAASAGTAAAAANAPPDPFSALSQDEKDNLNQSLLEALADANGSHAYSNLKSLVGYISADKFLVVPKVYYEEVKNSTWDPVDLKVLGKSDGIDNFTGQNAVNYKALHSFMRDTNSTGNEDAKKLMLFKIAAMNFMHLENAISSAQCRFVVSMLRARYCLIGALHIASQDNLGTYNEVISVETGTTTVVQSVVDIANATTIQEVFNGLGTTTQTFLDCMKNTEAGMAWVVNKAENIWAAVEHAFRVRSHHFKSTGGDVDSFKALYTRYLTACYEGNFVWPSSVDMFEVFHTCVHPFKIKALPVIAAHMVAHGLVATGGIIRFGGSPCGRAKITTTRAAIYSMKGEIWYSSFENYYAREIAHVDEAASEINDDKYSFHIAADLYGLVKRNTVEINNSIIDVIEVEASVSAISAACQGMISALETAVQAGTIKKFSLQNAKALEKSASNAPLLTLRIKGLIEQSITAVGEAVTVQEAIDSALPQIKQITNPSP